MLGGGLALFVYCHGWSRCQLRGHFESWRSFRQRRLLDGSGASAPCGASAVSVALAVLSTWATVSEPTVWSTGASSEGTSRAGEASDNAGCSTAAASAPCGASAVSVALAVLLNMGDGLGAHGWSRCQLRGHFESWRSFRQRRLLDGSGLRPVRRVRRFSRR